MDKTEQNQFDETLREREIRRLTSPLNYKGKILTKAYDIEGNEIKRNTNRKNEFIMEPKQGILTDDEILKYAYNSDAAAKIRLKKGIGTFEDKKNLHRLSLFYVLWVGLLSFFLSLPFSFGSSNLALEIISLIILLVTISYPIYILFLKDYTSNEYNIKSIIKKDENKLKSRDMKEEIKLTTMANMHTLKRYENQVIELKQLYKVKEKLARSMIEKKFSPTELTYDRFISSLNSCNNLFNDQVKSTLNIINFATDNSPKVEYEIKNRIDILKLIIEKVDELTNELVLNMNSLESDAEEIKYLVEDMEKLIKSVKDYK